jgi:hypothetical protein
MQVQAPNASSKILLMAKTTEKFLLMAKTTKKDPARHSNIQTVIT